MMTCGTYGIGLIFDLQTEARLRAVWGRLARQGCTTPLARLGCLPHVSLVLSDKGRFRSTFANEDHDEPTIAAHEPTWLATSLLNPHALPIQEALSSRGVRDISRPCPRSHGPQCPAKTVLLPVISIQMTADHQTATHSNRLGT